MYHLYFYLINRRNEKRNPLNCNWDDLWQINCFLKDMVVISYNKNLITNIGSGVGATHTQGKDLYFPIVKLVPSDISGVSVAKTIPNLDIRADRYLCENRKVRQIIRSAIKIRSRISSLIRKGQ